MAGLVNQLIGILSEQAERYDELLGLSLEKREAIIKNEIDDLKKITNLENIIISQNQKLERKRISVTNDIALVLNRKAESLTLAMIADMLQGQPEQQEITEIRERMSATLTKLSEANKQNALLIKNALEYTEYSINVIRSATQQIPAGYGEACGYTDMPGLFDSKK